jgi:hypothetical protein
MVFATGLVARGRRRMAPTHALPTSLATLLILLAPGIGADASATPQRPPSAPGIAAANGAPTPPMLDADFTFHLYSALRRTTTPPTFAELTPQALRFDFAPFCLMPREEERKLRRLAAARLTAASNQQGAMQLLKDCHVRVFAGERGGRARYLVVYTTPAPAEDHSPLFREATGDDVIIGAFGGGDARAAGYARHIF